MHPFDLISVDTIGGLSNYGSSKKYIHLIMDHATKYAWTFACKNQNTDSYISCITQILQIAQPKKIPSDQNPAFTASKFKRFLKNRNIIKLLTSTQRPQCNGLNERTNQTLISKLKCQLSSNGNTSWPQLLKKIIYDFNRTPHEVIGFCNSIPLIW